MQKDFDEFGETSLTFSPIFQDLRYTLEELKAKEAELIQCFGDLCYNQLSREGENNPLYGLKFTPQNFGKNPFGVYKIFCKSNNKVYYGQTEKLAARISQHKNRLKRGIHENAELQKDYNLFGQENFEYSVVYSYTTDNKEVREAEEAKLVKLSGNLCYNTFTNTSRKGENNPMSGRKHTPESKKLLANTLASKKPQIVYEGRVVILKGITSPSMAEASRKTKITIGTIRSWLKNPNNQNCVYGDSKTWNKPVSIEGTTYPSITNAAEQRGCGRPAIRILINTREDCFFIED
jgi:group I intron endonuclease